ncbi:hypothetical protein MHU86_18928 [Fragilaria crotonensis]|nr:hypothetical protein MHU86_18928 [Fragilaria crotonensis]
MWTSTLEIIQLAMAHFNAVDWSQVMAILRAHVMVVRPHVSQFLEAHQEALIAPLLWALLAMVALFFPKPSSTSPEPDPKELPSRRHRRALNTIARSHDARMFPKPEVFAPWTASQVPH